MIVGKVLSGAVEGAQFVKAGTFWRRRDRSCLAIVGRSRRRGAVGAIASRGGRGRAASNPGALLRGEACVSSAIGGGAEVAAGCVGNLPATFDNHWLGLRSLLSKGHALVVSGAGSSGLVALSTRLPLVEGCLFIESRALAKLRVECWL